MSPDDPTLQKAPAEHPEQGSSPEPQESLTDPGEPQATTGEPSGNADSSQTAATESPAAERVTIETRSAPEPPPDAPAEPVAEVAPAEPAPTGTPETGTSETGTPETGTPETGTSEAGATAPTGADTGSTGTDAGGPATPSEPTPDTTPTTDTTPAPAATDPPAASPEPQRPRVTLNPAGSEEARAVPSLQGGETSAQPAGEAGESSTGSPRPPAPSPPVTGVEIPRSAELDPTMEAELAAAMADNPLSATINEQTAGGPTEPVDVETLQPGARLKGTVQIVGEETVFVDIGLRSPGMIQSRQFPDDKPPEVGQSVEVVVDRVDAAEGSVLVSLPKARRKPAGNWDAVARGQVIDAMVTKTNKGGLEVSISNLRGFLPASQVDLGFVENLESYVGQKLTCLITEVNPQKRNLVVSRRAYLQQERQEREKELWQQLEVDQSLDGTVKTIKDYGAFVDLGGVDGFLHVGEISWNRIGHPGDVLKVGDVVRVRILKLDPESKKIGLGMKQLQQNPWGSIEQKYPVGSTAAGRVTRTTDFGAFVELEQGVEGLIHISELEHRRVGRVTDVVNEGDQVDAKVLSVDPGRKRISLSLKALKSKPEPAAAAVPTAEPYERKRKGPLRGGKEGESSGPGGGLFGNPDDFRR